MVIIITGVSGSGKTTIGEALANQLGWIFRDADDFHPEANIAKMKQGTPLNDADRQPWLKSLKSAIAQFLESNTNAILACSALTDKYRQLLSSDSKQVEFIYLKGSFDLIQHRLKQRKGHYMKADLLQSQFDLLEEPTDALVIDITQSAEVITQQIIRGLEI
jgi:gluconokinase